MIPLEDNFTDVLGKALRGQNLSVHAAAARAGLDTAAVTRLLAGEFAADPARALEEERRLAYVAWTRARRSLTLVYDPDAPSRFLREAFDDEELGAVGP